MTIYDGIAILLELGSAACAGTALYKGLRWARQDHEEASSDADSLGDLRVEEEEQTQRIKALKEAIDLRSDKTVDRAAWTAERDQLLGERALLAARIKRLEDPEGDAPVIITSTALRRAKRAAIYAAAAIALGALAGIVSAGQPSDNEESKQDASAYFVHVDGQRAGLDAS